MLAKKGSLYQDGLCTKDDQKRVLNVSYTGGALPNGGNYGAEVRSCRTRGEGF